MNCNVDGCMKPVKGRGWCSMHYARWRKTGDTGGVEDRRHREPTECSIDGCHGRTVGRGWCGKHYARWREHGDPETTLRPTYGEGRSPTNNGYMRVWAPDHTLADSSGYVLEHRLVAWETFGPFDPSHHVHHLDENKLNNDPSNLAVKSAPQHLSDHAQEDGITNQHGHWPTSDGPCAVNECSRPRCTREWCVVHYSRWQRTGDPLGVRRVSKLTESPYRLVA